MALAQGQATDVRANVDVECVNSHLHGEEACLLTNLTRTWENYMKCVQNSVETHTTKKLYKIYLKTKPH